MAYDQRWPAQAAAELQDLTGPLGTLVVYADHIDSTSVPQMAAKHILDLQVSVRDLAEAAAAFDVPLARLGYRRRSFNLDHVPAGDSSDPSLLGRRCREARCGAGTAAGRGELPHDVAVNRQRGRQPACDCGRCPLGGRHVLVPDGRGYAQGAVAAAGVLGISGRDRSGPG